MTDETRSTENANYMSTPSDGETVIPAKVRDDQFYFTFLTFEVEGVLFKVPRHPFENESEVFKDMFALPITSDHGTSDDMPIALHGVAVKHFRAFLRVLFDPAHGTQGDLNKDEWSSVLHLAHMWSCNRLFALAISKLDGLDTDPVSKITMAKAYNITDWLQPAYFRLVTRSEPLTFEEANELGLECAMKLGEIRESRYRWIIDDLDSNLREPQTNYLQSTGLSSRLKKGKKAIPVRARSPVNVASIKRDLGGDVQGAIAATFGLPGLCKSSQIPEARAETPHSGQSAFGPEILLRFG